MVTSLIRSALLASIVSLGTLGYAQLPVPQPKELVGVRSLALSPQGDRVAFVWRGDIWVAPSAGGRAVPITNHIEMEDNPVWSPDGAWIAFSSNRTGNNDVFLVPSSGGTTQRLTWHSGSDIPSDWSPDGKRILLSGRRTAMDSGVAEIDVTTTAFRQLAADFMGMSNPTYAVGGQVLYIRHGYPWNRPRYQGSRGGQLWLFDQAAGTRRELRSNGFQHLWPQTGPDGTVYTVTVTKLTPSSPNVFGDRVTYVDDAERTPNVYAIDGQGRAKRLTNYVGGGVRFLTVAEKSGLLAYEYEGKAFTLKPGGVPTPVSFTASIDDKFTNEERLILTTGATQAALSPNGEKVAFVVRDEIWMRPTEGGKGPNADDAVQLTRWAGVDGDPLWHPNGKDLYFTSDREDSDRIYKLDIESREVTPVVTTPDDAGQMMLTPDGDSLSFWISSKGIYKASLSTGRVTEVFKHTQASAGGFGRNYDWSPDMKYVAYTRSVLGVTNVYLIEVETGEERNVTRLNVGHSVPRFSQDGKFLYFGSNRESDGIYLVPLQKEGARPVDTELTYTKPPSAAPTEIDFDGIHERVRLFVNQSLGAQMITDFETGSVYFTSGGDIYRASYNGQDVTRLTSSGGIFTFEFANNGDEIVYVTNGTVTALKHKQNNRPTRTFPFRADWVRDVRAERLAALNQLWRNYNARFYDDNFHGRDWLAIRDRYIPLLDSVGHRNEMAIVLGAMVHELEASHSEVGPGGGNPAGDTSAHPGFVIDESYSGPGIKVLSVPEGAPGSFAATKIEPGEIVLKINGKPVQNDESLWRDVLNGETGRDLRLTVNATASDEGAREVKYRALSAGDWSDLQYRNDIRARKKFVEEMSDGQIAYIHIAGMGGANLTQFNREAWEEIQGKKAVILDVRFNGGGNISESLIDMIERVPHSFYRGRDNVVTQRPTDSWNLPTVVMMNERSASNAEMFPYSMRERGLAEIVGMPTPGYVIGTLGLPLVDGTSARMPISGVFRKDGVSMENNGVQPDHKIDWPVEDYLRGVDPQLKRAVEVLLRKVR